MHSAAGVSSRVPGWLLVVVAVFSVQFGNALGGSLFSVTGPLGAAALRLCFAAIVLWILVRPRVAEWTRRQWIGAASLGAALAGMNALIYVAIAEIPIGIAVTVELLGPLAVAAAGIRRPAHALWVVLAFAGILLLGSGLGNGAGRGSGLGSLPLAGVLAAVGAAACWALYIVTSVRLGPSVRGVDGLAVALAFGALTVLPFGAGQAISGVVAAPWVLLAFLGLAVLTSVVPYGLEFVALKRMPSRVFGVLSSLGPAVAALAGLIVLGQGLSAVQVAAIVLVAGASAGAVASKR